MTSISEILDSESHDQFIQNNPKGVIFFGSHVCGHCRKMLPVYQELARTFPDIAFAHVDVNKVTPRPIDLDGVPSFAFYYKTISYDKVIGELPDEFRAKVGELHRMAL